MNINITFVVQIINFWITYFFLTRLLLKPMVVVLRNRGIAREKMKDALKEREFFLKERVEEKARALVEFRRYLKRNYTVQPVATSIDVPEIEYHRDRAEIDAIMSSAKKYLKGKVPDAC